MFPSKGPSTGRAIAGFLILKTHWLASAAFRGFAARALPNSFRSIPQASSEDRVRMDGKSRHAEESSMVVPVLADYFRTMGGDLLYGREFTDQEVRTNANVVIVNERFARRIWLARRCRGARSARGKLPLENYRRRPAHGLYGGWRQLFRQVFVPAPSPIFATFVARVETATRKIVWRWSATRSARWTRKFQWSMRKRWSGGWTMPCLARTSTAPQSFLSPRSRCCLPSSASTGSSPIPSVKGPMKWGYAWPSATTPARLRVIVLRARLHHDRRGRCSRSRGCDARRALPRKPRRGRKIRRCGDLRGVGSAHRRNRSGRHLDGVPARCSTFDIMDILRTE